MVTVQHDKTSGFPDSSIVAGELFLRFCAFVRQLGVAAGRKTMIPTVLDLRDDGEVEERSVVATCPPGKKQPAGGEEVGARTCRCMSGYRFLPVCL